MAVSDGSDAGNDYVVIREIYEHDAAQEEFENELEQALESKVKTIVIEPTKLGDETARWISVGNCLHKTAVLTGFGSLAIGLMYPQHGYLYMPLGFTSVICSGVYAVSWQFDPCCKYQIEYDSRKLQRLPLHNLSSSSPVVLIRKDDTRRKVLQNSLSLAAGIYCGWQFYKWYST
ncbi:transmembrane protein 11-B, mitochondrial-like [Lineus longissimus]|uniref:transmembrane protein 11-B, mitochondrial-like n=1 Tax=Lineus longissimus TaxID=88925 RepID=UPI00315CDC5C